MKFELLTKQLLSVLSNKGWQYLENHDKKFIVLKNDFIFLENIEIMFPIDRTVTDFPTQLRSSINSIIQVDHELKKLYVIRNLAILSKNIENKFSKVKKEWILREPDSKYKYDEIPNIYVPGK